MNAQSFAILILQDVLSGRSLDDALSYHQQKIPAKDLALVKELSYGVLRWYYKLNAIFNDLVKKPPKDDTVRVACLVGFYQLLELAIPPYAATSETVNALQKLRLSSAKSLVNAVLRRFLREKTAILEKIDASLEARYQHPLWLINQLKWDWPNDWEAILAANNQRPVMTIRLNLKKIGIEDYLALLTANTIHAKPDEYVQGAILLEKPVSVEKLPGFQGGWVSVQDLGAQFCSQIIPLKPHQCVLDACAAPGGKATHLLEREPTLQLTAVEKSSVRIKSLQSNISRLKLAAKVIEADITTLNDWWDGVLFDVVVVDAPCSGTGVIKRHPDIKLLRRESDIAQFASQQFAILDAVWCTLKQGGELIYITCSVLKTENDQVVQQFLQKHQNADINKANEKFGVATDYGRQLLPTALHDGFYLAHLTKAKLN